MKILQEIIQVLLKYKTNRIEILEHSTKKNSQLVEFYDGIIDGTITSDEDAAAHFFEGDTQGQNYKNLKTKLKNRLINTIFFVDTTQSMFNDFNQAKLNCYKEWAAAKILISHQARASGVNICLKVLKQAKKIELPELIIEISKDLRNYYGTRRYDKKKFEEYNALIHSTVIIREKEIFAEECYLRMIQYQLEDKVSKSDFLKEITAYSNILKADLNQFATIRIIFFAGMLEVTKYMYAKDYRSTINSCDKLINLLLSKDIIFKSGVAAFSFQIMTCYTQLQEFEKGRGAFEKLNKYIEPGAFNWFKVGELYMFLLFYSANYQLAAKHYKYVLAVKEFELLPTYIKETWGIFKAYLHFLTKLGFLDNEEKDNDFAKFRLGNFLKETVNFDFNKRGVNIAKLIIQVLFSISQKNYRQANDRITNLEKYSSSYLKKDENFRSNCFIKMLSEIPKERFHKAAVERKVSKFRKKLEEVPLSKANHNNVEIIPFESLWEITLSLLGFKRIKKF